MPSVLLYWIESWPDCHSRASPQSAYRPETVSYTHLAKVLWCPAVISYDESGAGKITWFDVAPGLVYSLSADSGASRDALLDMVNRLFTPAQGEVG